MNKISLKPEVGDYVKVIKGVTNSSRNHFGKIVRVTSVEYITKKKDSDWYINIDIPDDGGLWPDEFIIVSSISKSQKQHILDLIKSI